MGKGTGTCSNRPGLALSENGSNNGEEKVNESKTTLKVNDVIEFLGQAQRLVQENENLDVEGVKKSNSNFYAQWQIIFNTNHSQTPLKEIVRSLGEKVQQKFKASSNDGADNKSSDSKPKNQKKLSEEEAQQDYMSKQAGKKGTFKSDDQKYKLRRPAQNCIECGKSFLNNDAFHWTNKGPVHGWGSFNKYSTCNMAKNEKNTPPPLRCAECGDIIYKDQPAHPLQQKGVWIHGEGTKQDTGTCLIAHNRQLKEALQKIGDDFVAGKVTRKEMLQLAQEVEEVENKMQKTLYKAWENRDKEKYPGKYKKYSKNSSSSGESKDLLEEGQQLQSKIKKAEDLADMLVESELDKDIQHLKDTDHPAYQKHKRYLDKQDANKNLFELYQDLLIECQAADQRLEEIDAMLASEANPVAEDFASDGECHCGSGMPYVDCHLPVDQAEEAGFQFSEQAEPDVYTPSPEDEQAAEEASQG